MVGMEGMHEAMMVCSALSTGWHDVDIDVDTDFVCLKEIVSKIEIEIVRGAFFSKGEEPDRIAKNSVEENRFLGRTAYGRANIFDSISIFILFPRIFGTYAFSRSMYRHAVLFCKHCSSL